MPDITEVLVGPPSDPEKYTLFCLTDADFGYRNGLQGPNTHLTYLLEGDAATDARQVVDILVGSATFGTPPFAFPQPHLFPGTKLRCLDASLAGHLGPTRPDSQIFGSDYVAIRAEYGTTSWSGLDYSVDGSENEGLLGAAVPWSSVDIETRTEEYPATGITDGITGVKRTFKVHVPITEYQIGRSYIPYPEVFIPIAEGLAGTKNASEFCGVPAGNMRMLAPKMSNHWDQSGGLVRTFLLTFLKRPFNWNYVLKSGTTDTWVQAKTDADEDAITYPDGDFSVLLTYGVV